MAIPGVACAILFAFTLCWNEFLYSLVFIQDELYKTLSVGVFTDLVRGDIYFWGSLMAACLTGSIPIIMDYYVSGPTAGAIKYPLIYLNKKCKMRHYQSFCSVVYAPHKYPHRIQLIQESSFSY
jgi:hypothetical protein